MNGDGPIPIELWLGRLCEEFHCLPSAALREWMRAPAGLLEDIIEVRTFAEAKRMYDAAEQKRDIPQSPIFELVKIVDFELAQEARTARAPADEHRD